MLALRLVLLLAAVLGAVVRPRGLPAWVAPVVATAVALASTAMTPADALHSLRPLGAPIAFLLAAIPLAVLLDRAGYFRQLAALFGSGRSLVPGLWVLGMLTVAVLNLDAAVVLLTPLYVNIARTTGRSERSLGFQPVILALLASSFLPVSNLTNLIAAARTGVGPGAFLSHLGFPGLVACIAGYWCYRRCRPFDDPPAAQSGDPGSATSGATDRRVLLLGTVLVVGLLVGFLAGPLVGAQPWEVALAGDVVLILATRRLPIASIPWGTALVAGGLGMLATSAASGLPLGALLGGAAGPLATLRIAAVSAVGANIVNNLPALVVALPFVSRPGEACSLWPVLLGVNAGPGLLVTGSLASLLWVEAMGRLGVPVTGRQFLKMGLRVSLPAAAAALVALVAVSPLVGCR